MASVLKRIHSLQLPAEISMIAKHTNSLKQPLCSSPLSLASWRFLSSSAPDGNKPKLYTVLEVRQQLLNMVGIRTEWGSDTITAGSGAIMQPIVECQDKLPRKIPSDSYAQAIIPLGTDAKVREKYLTMRQGIRLGRLLEDFDSMAGLLCYKHNRDPSLGTEQKSPFAFVTALVDRIDIDPQTPISPMKDIYIDGNVTWVGRSSMECTMHMSQDNGDSIQRLITAQYLFVARNPLTKKAAVVSPLDPQTDEDKELFRKGEENKARRVAEGLKSLLKVPPSEEERLIIHDAFLSTVDLKSGTLKSRIKPPNSVWMEDTILKTLIICQPEIRYLEVPDKTAQFCMDGRHHTQDSHHLSARGTLKSRIKPPNSVWMEDTILKTLIICQPEQRNLYNKIFGGFLMRKAYELAWTSASLYSKKHPPMCKTVDDIVFRRPVEIGSLLFLSSQIVYTNGQDIQIKVHAEVVNPETGDHDVTNDFHFTFDTGLLALPQVLPKSYAEAMLYVDGKRHYET